MSSKSKDWKEVVIAGGVAGVCSRTAIAPIERIKILYQISSGESGIASLFTTVVKKEGVLRLWRGNSAAVIRVVPYLSTQFLAYEKYKETLIPLFSDTAGATGKNAVTLAAGSAAGVTAVLWRVCAALIHELAPARTFDSTLAATISIYMADVMLSSTFTRRKPFITKTTRCGRGMQLLGEYIGRRVCGWNRRFPNSYLLARSSEMKVHR
eukprot:m.477739 g.477739  ORF g.477739 m.477739 type:complete len:210 (+) comp21688_c1_seq49:385-1014(+)